MSSEAGDSRFVAEGLGEGITGLLSYEGDGGRARAGETEWVRWPRVAEGRRWPLAR